MTMADDPLGEPPANAVGYSNGTMPKPLSSEGTSCVTVIRSEACHRYVQQRDGIARGGGDNSIRPALLRIVQHGCKIGE